MAKKVLGRGLEVYFPDLDIGKKDADGTNKPSGKEEKPSYASAKDNIAVKANTIINVPVNHIRANPHQPRTEFDAERLEELADSIKTHGLIQPITVRYLGEKRFELISGERRLRASKLAGIDEIPAYIREADDEQSMAFALIENIQREDLNALEVALAYQRLIEEFSYTQAQVADKVGKNRTTVTNTLRLLTLPDFLQSALKNGLISMGHARSLITIEKEQTQKKLLSNTIENDWSVRQLEEAVRSLEKAPKKAKKSTAKESDPILEDLSAKLRKKLSTRVEIVSKRKGGEIKIEYYSDDDLERILNIIDSF